VLRQDRGESGHDREILFDESPDARALHLDGDLLAGEQCRHVDLGDRGGGGGLAVEVGEDLAEWPPEL